MNENWQTYAALGVVVFTAALFLIRFLRGKGGSCGGGCCPAGKAKAAKPKV